MKPILQAEHLRRVGVFHLPPAVEEPDTAALFRSDRSAEDALQLAQLRTCLQFKPTSMEKILIILMEKILIILINGPKSSEFIAKGQDSINC